MRQNIVSVLMVTLFGVAGGRGLAKDVILIQSGQSRVVIVAPAEVIQGKGAASAAPSTYYACDAAGQRRILQASVQDLSMYLEKIGSTKVPLVSEIPVDPKLVPILIGSTCAEKLGKPKSHFFGNQAFRFMVTPKAIGLFGESELATSYAVYELLDRLGCRWYMPGELGEVIPRLDRVAIPECDESLAPGTVSRCMAVDEAYARRNRLGGVGVYSAHALEMYLTDEDKAAHPEWIATVAEKPWPSRLKWSAPGLADAIGDKLIARLNKQAEPSLSLSPNDGATFDDSAADRAWDAGDFDPSVGAVSITDRLIRFCNQIVARVRTKYPDELFGMLAYVQYTRPPLREKLDPNLIPVIAPITYSRNHPMTDDGEPNNKTLRHIVTGWGRAAPRVAYYLYQFNLAEPSSPYPIITKLSIDLPILYQNHCAFWQPENLSSFETSLHGLYLGNRMAWDPRQDPAKIVDEINRNFYGHAAVAMSAYWKFIDEIWVKTPEYSGGGFGHLHRFTRERMAGARKLMDAGLAACKTPQETARVKLAAESLRVFELFMKMRYDLAEGRWSGLVADAESYQNRLVDLAKQYQVNYAFYSPFWAGKGGLNGYYLRMFCLDTYTDATRLARDYQVLSQPPLRDWRYRMEDLPKPGTSATPGDPPLALANPRLEDSDWPVTDVAVETWSTLGHHNDLGSMWYRQTVAVPSIPTGKKVYLWISACDDSTQVYINGVPVPYVDEKGKSQPSFQGFGRPASFDITSEIKPGQKNCVAIRGTRSAVNEVGTGGLLGPVCLYQEK